MKTVAIFVNQEEARVVLSFLESHGVHAILGDADTFNAMPGLSLLAGHYRVMVSDEDHFTAQRYLAQVQSDHPNPARERRSPRNLTLLFILGFVLLTFVGSRLMAAEPGRLSNAGGSTESLSFG